MNDEWFLRLAVVMTRENIKGFACLMESDEEYRRRRAWLRLLGLMETWALIK
ncbi:hypothetical protein LCGC14_1494240 [marine sediment metagenome]|uniref:Uncharacterized protein n=1 Tax=marine sediment metagenome TaxID=412755 RepID=A0A0F9M7F9_9ZZZZ